MRAFVSDQSSKALGILIPTYNRCDALLECLKHLEQQTWKDFEVLIVDDGSVDATPERIAEYLKATSLSVRYVRQANSGPAKARNLGISMLNTPVCLMIGDDIFASPTLVEQHMAVHQKEPSTEVGALGWTQWSKSGQTITPFMRWVEDSPLQFDY